MIFAYTADNVMKGRKTQTRRVIKPDESFDAESKSIVKTNGRKMYQIGRIYAIQPGRTKPAIGHIRITGIRQESVEAISETDAIAEGYETPEEFFETWRNIHGTNADLTQPVWVIEFQLHDTNE